METQQLQHLGLMIDNSRNAVMKPQAVRRLIDLMAKMGYNTLMLYTEDTYAVQNQPYFGHLRGRYSEEELRGLDAYAAQQGIELIPCIQTLAHLGALMRWPQYAEMRDCHDILCVGEEEVYRLIEDIFATLDRCFTSRTVNIGMDEAEFIGLGRYRGRHGDVNRMDILLEHLGRVAQIGAKYGFELCMWGDMFFKLAGTGGGGYYNSELPPEIRARIPENVRLIYWDYYSTERSHYDVMIDQHQRVSDDIWFAGGLWSWTGFIPHNQYSIDASRAAMKSCRSHGIKDVFFTMWGDDGAECSRFSLLPAMLAAAEFAKGNFDLERIKERFAELFGIAFDDFMLIDLPGTPTDCPDRCNPEKYMLYNDCLMGLLDCTVTPADGDSYAACAARLEKMTNNPDFGVNFRTAKCLCDVLAVKYTLGVRTRAAYLAGDDGTALRALLPEYERLTGLLEAFYTAFEEQWMAENKPHAFEVSDVRLGGLIRRVEHCRKRIEQYLAGTLERIEELEEPVLDVNGGGEPKGKPMCFNSWSRAVSANVFSFGNGA